MAETKELKFDTHSFGIECYSAGDLRVMYGGRLHHICIGRIGRKKLPFDDRRIPLGILPGWSAFASPVEARWRTRDGKSYTHELDLEQIFRGRLVQHDEDPGRIFQPEPFVQGGPAIIVEANGRTLSVYLDAMIQILPPNRDRSALQQRRLRRVAFTKDF